jgi:hypothetical protein
MMASEEENTMTDITQRLGNGRTNEVTRSGGGPEKTEADSFHKRGIFYRPIDHSIASTFASQTSRTTLQQYL